MHQKLLKTLLMAGAILLLIFGVFYIDNKQSVYVPVIKLDQAETNTETAEMLIGCDDVLVFMSQKAIKGERGAKVALNYLFTGEELVAGTDYHNPLAYHLGDRGEDYKPLSFERLEIKGEKAEIYLNGDYISVGTCEPPRVEAVLEQAVKKNSQVKEVNILINGEPAQFIHGGPGEDEPEIEDGISMLLGSWRWLKMETIDGIISPVEADQFILTFNQGGDFNFTTDCNSGFGSYLVENNSLSLFDIGQTKMYCPDSQEEDFIFALSQVENILEISNESLLLGSEDYFMVFERL
ncbi:MAG: META domain-containing protein [Patescibacteria group bacterium]